MRLGPRNLHRALALGVIVAIVVVVLLTRPHGRASSGSRDGVVPVLIRLPVTEKLSYGMTRQQVLRRVGKPTKTLRDPNGMNCWQYDLGQIRVEAVRLCFFSGRYAAAHYEYDGKWDYKPLKVNVTG